MKTEEKKDHPVFAGKEVQLADVLNAREARVMRQEQLIRTYKVPLLCFTMNIAGPVKNNELIRRGFRTGCDDFKMQTERVKGKILHEEIHEEFTGNEAYFVVDMDGLQLKKLACELEENDNLGRLYDMDVLVPDESVRGFSHIDRSEIGLPERPCLICGKPGKYCASRRLHTVKELQYRTASILKNAVLEREASAIAEYAVRALLYEVSVTPKPGLVDRNDSGAHKDMDFYTFLNSSASLFPYFETCAKIGQDSAERDPKEVFSLLRQPGKLAENRMLRATGGINTHKGAIFTLGILCGAAGILSAKSLIDPKISFPSPEAVPAMCAKMTEGLTEHDFAGITEENAVTAGQRLYAQYGITGVRGQMEAGLPAVSEYGLPLLKKLLEEGKDEDEAGTAVLLSIIAHTQDTNMIHRSSVETQRKETERITSILEENACPDPDTLREMNRDYIARNLSPGGSADLLAACWFLYTMEKEMVR